MMNSSIKRKREFLSTILYDDQAYTLPDEMIITGYCAYHRLSKDIENAWIAQLKYESIPPKTGKVVFARDEEVDEKKAAQLELDYVEKEYQKIVQAMKAAHAPTHKKRSRKRDKTRVPMLDVDDFTFDMLKDYAYACYFFYGYDGSILYVGQTNDFVGRWRTHTTEKDVSQVARVEMHLFSALADVLFYEAQNIITHQPVWNKRDKVGTLSKFSVEPEMIVQAPTINNKNLSKA